ncbi:MarR family transcriptional regulator [Streptomyces longisporoflavus]|uniref:MarR family transcriptional regulator n=1 Tax=Streptomyces longisporoflavus TaxID=28044 RepID=UPI00167E9315|nr:MarR family transcriptional regulator [Streptomyces longisporoflavus]GGV66386.1 MarR family transcriptional regulator [Streptomyces longisporoflavus]
MSSVRPNPRDRRRTTTEIKGALRALSLQLTVLNRQVSARLALKDVDLDCLDLINSNGPLAPTALARQANLHPATLTGILDRLERAGWIARERDPSDRRAVRIRALRDRNGELISLYAEMNSAIDTICADYSEADLALLNDFLTRATDAGQEASRNLAAPPGER